MTTENRQAMERFLKAVGDGGYGDAFYARDVVVHDWTQGQRITEGRDVVLDQIIRPSRDAFPDGRIEVRDSVMADDTLVVRAEWVATFVHDYGDIPATGRAARWEILDQYRFRAGEIVEIWFAGDTLAAARALGALPDNGMPW